MIYFMNFDNIVWALIHLENSNYEEHGKTMIYK